ncbi:PREDICTED: F-box/kelch-repeat protein At3g23880-like [Ipomoea nil]|uniref:F-box/kelch-repeat protein At3g23880-like n=1 Tax=Ipomoea nil TaxID=35883 RepID=UPI000900AF4D|nr:PREDICTED: F-box/kelch-repeat protein At3g23880-like [Ipomoea nil]
MEASTPLSNIPNEIIQHILLQLPMKAVIRCQCVCKQWHSLINHDSNFKLLYRGQRRLITLSLESKTLRDSNWNSRFLVRSTTHDFRLQRHKCPFGEAPFPSVYCVTPLCSCNGFVLLGAGRKIVLWNPSTRCLTKVLKLPYPDELKLVILGGLCYDPCTRDYKVVLLIRSITQPRFEFGYPFVISASLNHKEWRPMQFPYDLKSARGSVEFRNTFHWWASDIKDWDWDIKDWDGDRNMILYFDPVRDEFRILPTPELRKKFSIVGLGVIDDCLSMACIVHKAETFKTQTMQVLIMKEYGIQESWMTAFAIQMPQSPYTCMGYYLTFYSQKNNAQEVLFLRITDYYFWGKVYVYDRRKDELKEVRIDFLEQNSGYDYFGGMCFYVESFIN